MINNVSQSCCLWRTFMCYLLLSFPSRRIIGTARAWSIVSPAHVNNPTIVFTHNNRNKQQQSLFYNHLILRHRGGSSSFATRDLRLFNQDSSRDNEDDLNEEESSSPSSPRIPKTGLNHNPPDESSGFWESPNGNTESKSVESASSSSNKREEPRTGWLHNTKPRKSLQETKQSTENNNNNSDSPSQISQAQLRLKRAMLEQERNHRIVSPPTFHACGNGRQIVVTDHRLSVPIYHLEPVKDTTNDDNTILQRPTMQRNTSPRIDLAFTIVEQVKNTETQEWFESLTDMTPAKRAQAYLARAALTNADKMILYLQGGPGFGAPTPVTGLGFGGSSSWGAKALETYDRVVLMDQRGTGRSTPITKQTLEKRFPQLFQFDGTTTTIDELNAEQSEQFNAAVSEATEYMAQFRADNIVKDAEYLREALLLPLEEVKESSKTEPRPWGCALGQSFGGFCMLSYLSTPNPPKICLLTGGIAPVTTAAYDIYSSLWERVKERSLRYYEMYPGDVPLIKKIITALVKNPPKLPSGGTLTARRFLSIGVGLGGGPAAFASLHSTFQSAFLNADNDSSDDYEFTRKFLKDMDAASSFDEHPIYYWLHESIYADGPNFSPTNWAADRAYQDKITNVESSSDYDYMITKNESDPRPVLFFGEMVFPWMSQDFAQLSKLGATALANSLATKSDWKPLYDCNQIRDCLQGTTKKARAAAAVYYEDLYVDFNLSMKLTVRGGPLQYCKTFVTNEYQHSGLRDDGANIFTKLHGMATGSIRTPS